MARSRALKRIQRKSETEETLKDNIELLRCRAGLLTGKDKALIQMYLDNANTYRQMARISGVNEANIARRIHKVIRRLLDGEYITCLRNRDQFTPVQMEIAHDYFILGISMKNIATRHEVTIYTVRKTMRQIQHLVQYDSKKKSYR